MPETSLEALIRRQHETWTRMQEIVSNAESEGRDLTADERTNWDAANNALDGLDGDIRRQQTMASREHIDRSQIVGANSDPEATPEGRSEEARQEEYKAAFYSYMRRGMGRISEVHRSLLMENHVELGESRAAGQGTGSAGGYLVPEEFLNKIAVALKAYGGILQYCNVITTTSGTDLSWPTSDDTGNEGAILAENTQISEQDLTFGQRRLGAHTYTSKLVRVPWSLLNDSVFEIDDFLAARFGERIGRAYARHLTAGTGSGQPEGVLTNITVGKTGAVSAQPAITYDDVIDLEHSVDPAYRDRATCYFGMPDGTLKILRKLKDSQGRPLWQPVPAPGFPSQINGRPYFVDNSMPAPAAGVASLIFGDFYNGMIVRQVQGIQSVRLEERYADFLQTGFFAFSRMDAKPDDPRALAAFKHGAAS